MRIKRAIGVLLPLLFALLLYFAWLLTMPQELSPLQSVAVAAEGGTASRVDDPGVNAPGVNDPRDNSPDGADGAVPVLSATPAQTPQATPAGATSTPDATPAGATPAPTLKPFFTPHPNAAMEIEQLYIHEDEAEDGFYLNVRRFYDGRNTAYIAHAYLRDPARLKTAFARDKFGRNLREHTRDIAERNGAVFAINGDFYGYRDEGIIIRGGTLYRNKPSWRDLCIFYDDGTMDVMPERDTTADALLAQGAMDTFSFGPALVRGGEIQGGVYKSGIRGANPRSGVGMVEKNHYVFITVDGRKKGYSVGMKLEELAQLFIDEGCTVAYNLDGGGSATMCYQNELINRPQGTQRERSISDIIYIS